MATTARHIVSDYTTPEQEGDEVPEHELESLWNTESAKLKVTRGAYKIPTFVKGVLTDGVQHTLAPDLKGKAKEEPSVSGWYHELSTSRATALPPVEEPALVASTSSVPSPSTRSTSLPLPPKPRPRGKARRAQPDWFIHRALDAQAISLPASTPSTPPPPSTGLAGLLAQQPPPKPDEAPFKPPIHYALDPTNKGFAMLRRSGWEEGYGLGHAHAPAKSTAVIRAVPSRITAEEEQDGPEVVDLTESRSPTPEGESIFIPPEPTQPSSGPAAIDSPSTALLTPLRPVLKNDRLGLGLKAKKKSHLSSKEIAEHIRAGREAQRKAEMEKHGRGARGFAKQAKKDAEARRALMSYMNS